MIKNKKPVLKVYFDSPKYNPFDVYFVFNKDKYINNIYGDKVQTNIKYKYIYEHIYEIIIDLQNDFAYKYKLKFYRYQNKKIIDLDDLADAYWRFANYDKYMRHNNE
jgi:hypothetical protein